MQEKLRRRVKVIKALNDDIYYKDFAEYLDMDINSFYNWLHNYYRLGESKYKKLKNLIDDMW